MRVQQADFDGLCQNCQDPTKRTIGHFLQTDGAILDIYGCKNTACTIYQGKEAAAAAAARAREQEVRAINERAGIDPRAFDQQRKGNGLTLKEISTVLGATAAEYCAWIYCRRPFPPEKYDAGLEYFYNL